MEQQVKEFESLVELLDELENRGIQGRQRKDIVFAYLGDRAKVKGRPIVASFELTPYCNFDCKMCYVHLEQTQLGNSQLLTVEQWKRIIDMSVDAGIMAADITGGECLTYPGFKDVYMHLWAKGIQPCVLTNGSLLSEDIVDFFVKHPPKMIQVSIYGSDEKAYKEVTRCNAYRTVMRGIQRLKQARLHFKLVLTPSRYMQEDAEKLLEMVRNLGVEYGVGGISLPARSETGRELADFEIDATYFAKIQKNEIEYRKALMNSERRQEQYPMKPAKRVQFQGAPCGAAHNNFHVNWKGEMCPCISFHEVTCSMLDKGFDHAWQEIQRQMTLYTEHAECLACEYRDKCLSCPAEKCFGNPCGPLNTGVCQRMRAYAEAGLLGITRASECILEGDESNEEGVHEAESLQA